MATLKTLLQSLALSAKSLLLAAACASSSPPTVVDYVDLNRYQGTWYEVASFPIRAQRDCVGTTATYGERDDGDLSVYNACFKGSFDGEVSDIEGKAWVADETTNAKLWVRFFWPFRGSYWIVGLDDDYQWAVVSNHRGSTLWILSRQPCMDQARFEELYHSLKRRGFPMERLQTTLQRSPDGEPCQLEIP